jgi:hypothetical protein
MTTPAQYAINRPTLEVGGLSPLQLALTYYMNEALQVPFAVNTDFVAAIKTYSDSGVVIPSDLGLDGTAIIADGPLVKMIRRAENCGPLEIERYEQITIGNRTDLLPNAWEYGEATVRGGSISAGGGGPWGTGGLASAFPGPCNAVDRPPNLIVGGYFDAYSTGDSIAVVPGSDVNSSALNTTEGAVGANDNVG